jgi:hypothetical protein
VSEFIVETTITGPQATIGEFRAQFLDSFPVIERDSPEEIIVTLSGGDLDPRPTLLNLSSQFPALTFAVVEWPHEYRGVELSHTWSGGAHADGKNAWILISKVPDSEYVFIAEVPGHKRKGPLELQEQDPSSGTEVKPLWGKKFQKCPTR